MTVTTPDLPPSRAGSLPLVGGSLALDFVNTESGRGFPSHQNHLRTAIDVLDWLAHADTLSPESMSWLMREASRRPDLAHDLLTSAIALRSEIHEVGAAIGRGLAPPEAALKRLSTSYARCIDRGQLAPDGLAYGWRWSVRDSPVEAALGPIALAAVKLYTEGDLSRVKECGGHACGWLFYDRTKNNRRRWCEMEVCGNRAKQRRFAARRRGD